jgi:hypothetical protein
VALSANAIVTLAEAKDFLEVEGDDDNAQLEALIGAVSGAIEDKVDRKLSTRVYTEEVYNGTGFSTLTLREYPVTAVSQIQQIDNVTSSGTTWETQDITNLVILDAVTDDTARGELYWRDWAFPFGRANIRVSYTAGIDFTAGKYTLTSEKLKQATYGLLALHRRTQDKITSGVASRSFSGQSVTYMDIAFTKETLALLAGERRVGVA